MFHLRFPAVHTCQTRHGGFCSKPANIFLRRQEGRQAGKKPAGTKTKNGAPGRIRTRDPLITNQVLYQLSYKGMPEALA